MDDFQRFHKKALFWSLGGLVLIAPGCIAAGAAGLWQLVLILLPGGCFGIRIAYHIQYRRFNDRRTRK